MNELIKYKNLLIRDFLMCKFVFVYLFLYFFFVVIFPFDMERIIVPSTIFSIALVIMVLIYQIGKVDKNKGTEILLTASYTRKNIIISRYLFCLLIGVSSVVFEFMIKYIIDDFRFNLFILFLSIFFICVEISLLVPFSFNMCMTTYSFVIMTVSFSLEVILLCGSDFLKTSNFSNFSTLPTVMIVLISIAILVISYFVSKRIYLSKDL